jgi:hypothetical protein
MNNSNDQAQFAKDMYQFPSHKAEVFDTPELSDEQVDHQFTDIAREETRLAFEAIETHPDAMAILGIGKNVQTMRKTRHAEIIEIQTKRGFSRIVGIALGKTDGNNDTL